MGKKSLFLLGAGAFLVLGGAGCGQKSLADRQVEKNIEKNLGKGAEVDVDKDKINIKTEQGSLQVGGKIKLPDNFPKDVYIIDGEIMSAMNNVREAGYQVAIKSDRSLQEAKQLYETKLKDSGWKIINSMDVGTASVIMAQKEKRQLTITMGTEEGRDGLAVMINLANDDFSGRPN